MSYTITVLDRLKLDLNKKQYFEDNEYSIFLEEHGLNPTDIYNKDTMLKKLLETTLEILEKIMNDDDYMRKIESKDFGSTGSAYENLEKQVNKIKDKIIEIEDKEAGIENRSVFMMYYTNEL